MPATRRELLALVAALPAAELLGACARRSGDGPPPTEPAAWLAYVIAGEAGGPLEDAFRAVLEASPGPAGTLRLVLSTDPDPAKWREKTWRSVRTILLDALIASPELRAVVGLAPSYRVVPGACAWLAPART